MISGILKKTHESSFVDRFHVNSKYAERVLGENGNYVILQIMEISNQELLVELVRKDDYLGNE